jgi:hypothetical protein
MRARLEVREARRTVGCSPASTGLCRLSQLRAAPRSQIISKVGRPGGSRTHKIRVLSAAHMPVLLRAVEMAGLQGFEPRSRGPEPRVLPIGRQAIESFRQTSRSFLQTFGRPGRSRTGVFRFGDERPRLWTTDLLVRAGFEPALFTVVGGRFTADVLHPLAYLTESVVGAAGIEPARFPTRLSTSRVYQGSATRRWCAVQVSNLS